MNVKMSAVVGLALLWVVALLWSPSASQAQSTPSEGDIFLPFIVDPITDADLSNGSDFLWQEVALVNQATVQADIANIVTMDRELPSSYRIVELNSAALEVLLETAALASGAVAAANSNLLFPLPLPDGNLAYFDFENSPSRPLNWQRNIRKYKPIAVLV